MGMRMGLGWGVGNGNRDEVGMGLGLEWDGDGVGMWMGIGMGWGWLSPWDAQWKTNQQLKWLPLPIWPSPGCSCQGDGWDPRGPLGVSLSFWDPHCPLGVPTPLGEPSLSFGGSLFPFGNSLPLSISF